MRNKFTVNARLVFCTIISLILVALLIAVYLISVTKSDLEISFEKKAKRRAEYISSVLLERLEGISRLVDVVAHSSSARDLIEYKAYNLQRDYLLEKKRLTKNLIQIRNSNDLKSLELKSRGCAKAFWVESSNDLHLCKAISSSISIEVSANLTVLIDSLREDNEEIGVFEHNMLPQSNDSVVTGIVFDKVSLFLRYVPDQNDNYAVTKAAVNRIAIVFATLVLIVLLAMFFLWRDFFSGLALVEKGIAALAGGVSLPTSNVNSKLFEGVVSRLSVASRKVQESQKLVEEAALVRITRQVAHDIRSPLAALGALQKTLRTATDAQQRMLTQSIQRIQDISSNVLDSTKPKALVTKCSPFLLLSFLRDLVAEKRAEHPNVEIKIVQSISEVDVCLAVNRSDFSRVLSNLMNNSIEAYQNLNVNPLVVLKIEEIQGGQIHLSITDFGCGISLSNLESLGKASFSTKKGNGLGFIHAGDFVEDCKGSFQVESRVNKGTKVHLFIPVAEGAVLTEFVECQDHFDTLVVVDDDPQIANLVFDHIFEQAGFVNFIKLASPDALIEYVSSDLRHPQSYYLIDYDFQGSKHTGASLVAQLGLAEYATFLSNRYDDSTLVTFCLENKMLIIPKPDLSNCRIRSRKQSSVISQPSP